MEKKINGATPFQVNEGDKFSVAPTTAGYQVAFSADGENYTLDAQAIVPANENLIYIGAMPNVFYMLSGNTDNNVIIKVL